MNRVAKINPKDNPVSVPDSFWDEITYIGGEPYVRWPNGGGLVSQNGFEDEFEDEFDDLNALREYRENTYTKFNAAMKEMESDGDKNA